jgi:hypothetical protein
MSDTIKYYDAQQWLRERQPKRAKFPAVLVAICYPAHQRGFRPAGRTLFPWDILVLVHRHRLHLVAVHSDGPGAGAALSWLCKGKTILDSAQVRLLQHGLSSLLCPMVVLALVLLVVIVQLSSCDNDPSIASLTNSYFCIILSRSRAVMPVSL